MIGILACTKECNLRCRYCFEEKNFKSGSVVNSLKINRDFENAMPVFKKFGEELILYNQDKGVCPEFTFHGGEPLLIRPELIEQLCAYFRRLHPEVRFNVQTNGTICNRELINVLKKYNFRVGVSIDGTKCLNDENRIYENGRGSHDIILKNIKQLQKNGIQVGAMATITASVTHHVKEFYDFFAENTLNLGFNACYNSPKSSHQENQINDVQYSLFLKDLFDLWIADENHSINIQPFERIIRTMITKKRDMQVCQFIQDCREVNVCVDIDGNIYRCLHYCNLEGSELGNIRTEQLKNILVPFLEQPSHWDKMKNEKCGTCNIRHYCYGGCPYWKDASELTGLEGDFSCTSQKVIVHHIYRRVKNVVTQGLDEDISSS